MVAFHLTLLSRITMNISLNLRQDTLTVKLFLVGLSAPMVQVGKDITWQDSLILENEVTVLNNVLYGDLTGVFLVVGCTLFISLVNCLSEIPCVLGIKVNLVTHCWSILRKCYRYKLHSFIIIGTKDNWNYLITTLWITNRESSKIIYQ